MDVKGQAAVVTGGASGLGSAVARRLAAAGAKVAILDLNVEAAQALAAEVSGIGLRCDVADADGAASALALAQDRHGPARLLVNCAGIGTAKRIVGRDGPQPLADFERVIRVNLIGTFNMLRLAAASMSSLEPLEDGERGVVVATASVAAFEGQVGQAAYAASKGGIVSLTLPAARELAQFGIRVLTIAPGLFLTPLIAELPQETQAALAGSIPFPKRLGRPEEFAELVLHCAGNLSLNGEVIRLDGALRLAAALTSSWLDVRRGEMSSRAVPKAAEPEDRQVKRPMRDVSTGSFSVSVTRRRDGIINVRPLEPLAPYPTRLTDRLHHWAALAPDRVFIAERDRQDGWRSLTYAQALAAVRRLGQSLLNAELSAERPLLILSGNSVNHALLGLAALYVGVPYAPVSPPYALVSSDFAKLRHVIELLTPGLVYADDGVAYARAIEAVVPGGVGVLVDDASTLASRRASGFADFAAAEPTTAVDIAYDRVGPDTIGKFLLTSGSTGLPKAVINTQRMLSSNQVMLRETLAVLKEDPPVLVDWLPWNHTFGGNHNVGLVLFNGGSLYIDAGKPTVSGFEATVRNLRDIAPTIYFNVPKGWEMLVPRLRSDAALREHFFSRLKLCFFAGAGLAAHVWDALDDLALETVGARIPMLTGLGATETAPFSLSVSPQTSKSGHVGLPVPGNDLKLVPDAGKLEARVKGPNVTPGYWRQPDLTAAAFDEEGYYKFGDALRFVDENDITQGFAFDGRITEDFKLASGTWVSVGPLRAQLIEACAPCVRDFVVAGLNRDEIAVLGVPDIEACRALCQDLPSDAALSRLLDDERLRRVLRDGLEAVAAKSTGSSNRVTRGLFIDTPLSIDKGEVTDKGSVNQRAVLQHRPELVEELYREPASSRVIRVGDGR